MLSKPSDSELEILQVLWEKGPLTVRKVNDTLNMERRIGYTTTLKIMQIMVEKKTTDPGYRPTITHLLPTTGPKEVQINILDHVIKTAFRGNRSNLVLRALGNGHASSAEMAEIKALIEEIENKDHGTD